METISNTIQTASNALWSEVQALQLTGKQQPDQHDEVDQQQHGEEPLSGIQGKGTATDPYDAGNREDQPGSPESKDNTAVTTEPLASLLPREPSPQPLPLPKSNDNPSTSVFDQGPNPKPSTSNLGPRNPIVDEPESAQEKTNPTGGIHTHMDTLDKSPAQPEQKSRALTNEPQPENPPASNSADTSFPPTGTGGAGKAKVSEEALKGPKCPPPREPYEVEKKIEEEEIKKKEEGQSPTGKIPGQGGVSNGNGNHAKESSPTSNGRNHHHKSLKERLGKVVQVGHHLHHSNR